MPKKKATSKSNARTTLTKEDLVSYIGPVFQELKTKIDTVESHLTDKINWQGTLMEQMNKKIDLALELTEMTHSII